MNWVGLAVAVAVTGSPVRAEPPSEKSPSQMTKEQAAVAIMEYYPERARAEGVDGNALLKCRVTEYAVLMDCVLAEENPAGFGFGDAALALAKLTKDHPRMSETPSSAGMLSEFKFRLNPPMIEPNTLLPLVVITNPDFLERPDPARMHYPARAERAQVAGHVDLKCVVNEKGKVEACVVAEETPTGFGFGKAAIDFVSTYKMRPKTRDGVPTGGAHVNFPINFVPGP